MTFPAYTDTAVEARKAEVEEMKRKKFECWRKTFIEKRKKRSGD